MSATKTLLTPATLAASCATAWQSAPATKRCISLPICTAAVTVARVAGFNSLLSCSAYTKIVIIFILKLYRFIMGIK
ncbi:hypothetical protein AO370_1505 [Moraxella catarrhalis]|uniref:Secreted protein n=1 Tax=Moraxella catarrhalis TaxID=480 RepID=A0AB36DNG3_MORCA|nr:hypothetical protein AO370_1505 [Moraxella catarrhalis]